MPRASLSHICILAISKILQSSTRVFHVTEFVHRMVKIRNGKFRLSSYRFQILLRLRPTWPGGNESDWDGNGREFEFDSTFFFFKREVFPKK